MFLLLLLSACQPDNKPTSRDDLDGDGLLAADDCDDENAAIGGATLVVYADADGDGAGNMQAPVTVCSITTGQVETGGDCDDQNPAILPGATEVCDGVDQDCNTQIDDNATDATSWFADTDADGFGNAQTVPMISCSQPAGFSANSEDCDDSSAARHPGVPEHCDNTDEDCDGTADNNATDAASWYPDADQDGYGDPLGAIQACLQPPSTAANADDCDDQDSERNPALDEICGNGLDDDCDGEESSCGWTGTYNLGKDALARLDGTSSYGMIGDVVTSLGDVDGDGREELAVSSYQTNIFAGRAWIVRGADVASGTLPTVATAVLDGEYEYQDAARVMAGVGDVTGDGVPDLLLGGDRGEAAWIVSGDTSGTLSLLKADVRISGIGNDFFGTAIAAANDVNGDGNLDLLVGAPNTGKAGGAVYLFCGPLTDSTLTASDATSSLLGDDNVYAGYAVSGGHDLDGDGLADPVISTYFGPTSHGAVWIVTNPASGATDLSAASAELLGSTYTDRMAISVASIGDVNGDGYGEILVGAISDSDGGVNAGAIYLLQGPFSSGDIGNAAASKFLGNTSDGLGANLSGVGDLNNDGLADIALPDPNENSYRGSTYVFYGPGGSGSTPVANADAIFQGANRYDHAGTAVGSADVTGDGILDLLITANGWSATSQSYEGALYVVGG